MNRLAPRFEVPQPAAHNSAHGASSEPAADSGKPAPDVTLVLRCQNGDRAAQRLLYLQHVQSVNALAVRLLGRSADAEDVVQDAFVTALARIQQLRDPALFRAWLLRITVHEVHRRFRRRKLLSAFGFTREGDDAEPDASLTQLATPGLSAEAHAELRFLDRALEQLPARERIAWMLRHVEGLELTEVADACDTSLATIKRWLARADQHVRAHLTAEPDHD